MLCIKCRKNQATKTYERVVGGEKREEFYCLSCFHESFLSVDVDGMEHGKTYSTCPYCNTSVETLQKTSLVGCAHCYQTIGVAAIPMVVRMQGVEAHRGKTASVPSQEEQVQLRRNELLVLAKAYREKGDEARAKTCVEEYNRLTAYLRGGGVDGKNKRVH